MANDFWTSIFGWSNQNSDKFMQYMNNSKQSYYGVKDAVWVDTNKPFELYLQVPELRTVIDKRASMMASGIPILKNSDGEIVNDHQWVQDLIAKPNPTQSWSDVIYSLSVNDGLFANAFAYCPKRSFDIRNLIVPLPSSKVKLKLSGRYLDQMETGGMIENYQFYYDGKKFETIEIDDMVYINTPDGIHLVNPRNRIETLRYPLSNIIAQYKKRNVLLENLSAIGILSSNQSDLGGSLPMDPAEKRQIQKDWIKRNSDQIVITESNVDWTPMSYPTKQLMLFEELDADKMAIIDAYGLSQYLFASSKGATFTNVFEGMRMTYQDTIIPETDQLYATLSHQLGLTDQGLKLCADFSHVAVLQKDQVMQSDAMDKRANAVLKIIESGVELSDDEKRTLLGINNIGY
tara:strand:+ start:1241 stop:2452 length:1212 start_codon:yes stop_codon:yes gene_type:complete